MNYTNQEACQIENCEEPLESKSIGRSFSNESLAWNYESAEVDESIIRHRFKNNRRNDNSQIPMMKNIEETDRQLTRQRHHEKKAIRRRENQYHQGISDKFNTGKLSRQSRPPRSMHSKTITRDRRKIIPTANRYLSGHLKRKNQMILVNNNY